MIQPGWQEEIVLELVRLLEPDPDVRALVLFGTAAGDQADLWSDIDLLLVVAEGAWERLYPGTDWLKPLGELYACDQSSHDFGSVTRACFTNFRRVDLVITTEAALERWEEWPGLPFWKGTRSLFSRSARVDRALARPFPKPELRLPSDEQICSMANGFWFKGMLAVTKVARGDLLIALHLALEMVQDCCVLGMLLRDRAEGTAHHRHGGIGNDVVRELEATRFPYTATGILEMIGQAAVIHDDLTSRWAERPMQQREPLLAWIVRARQALSDQEGTP